MSRHGDRGVKSDSVSQQLVTGRFTSGVFRHLGRKHTIRSEKPRWQRSSKFWKLLIVEESSLQIRGVPLLMKKLVDECFLFKVKVKVLSPWTLWPHGLYSLPGSSVQEILQARTLEWVAIAFSKGIFWTQGSNSSLLCLQHWQVDSLPLALSGESMGVNSKKKKKKSQSNVHT